MNSENFAEQRTNKIPWRCGLLLSVIICNVILPSLVLSYGVILAYNADQGVPEWILFVCPAVFVIVICLTQCWCREAADSWGGENGYRIMASVGVLFVFAGSMGCAFTSTIYHPILYGLLGGLGTSLITSQVDTVIFDTYDTRLGIVRGLCYAGQAIGQFALPHVFLLIIEIYGSSMFYVILSAVILQTLPCVMLLKFSPTIKRPYSSYTRYSDVERNYAMFENNHNSDYTNDLQLYDLGRKCWQSLSSNSDNDDDISEVGDLKENDITKTPPPSPEEKQTNVFGIDILPQIPEESEYSYESENGSDEETTSKSSNKKHLRTTIRKLSVMSDQFEEYITRSISKRQSTEDEKCNSQKYSEIGVTRTKLNIAPTDVERENVVINSFGFRCSLALALIKRRALIPSYKIYRIRRRFKSYFYSIKDIFIKPMTRSLSFWRFYPSLLLCFSKLSLTVIFYTLIPMHSLQTFPGMTLMESNFLLSLHAFSWLCFLLSTPWIIRLQKRNYKYITVGGLIVSTAAVFVVADGCTHDAMAIGCVLSGFGFGAVISTSDTTIREFVGVRKWSKIQSTLETFSGISIGLFVTGVVYLFRIGSGIKFSLLILCGAQAIVTSVWLVISVVCFYFTATRSYNSSQSIWSH